MRKSEIKAKMTTRLTVEGVLKQYIARREQLKREGTPDTVAWVIALQAYPPKDGTPIEFPLKGKYAPLKDHPALKDSTIEPPPPPTMLSKDSGNVLIKYGPPKKGEPPLPKSKDHAKWNKLTDLIKNAPDEWSKKWAELASKVVDNRVGSELEVLRWAFQNAGTPPDALVVEDIPGLGALRLLRHLQVSDNNYSDFLRTNWPKLIPDKKQMEFDSRFVDDGRSQLAMMDALEKSLEEENVPAES